MTSAKWQVWGLWTVWASPSTTAIRTVKVEYKLEQSDALMCQRGNLACKQQSIGVNIKHNNEEKWQSIQHTYILYIQKRWWLLNTVISLVTLQICVFVMVWCFSTMMIDINSIKILKIVCQSSFIWSHQTNYISVLILLYFYIWKCDTTASMSRENIMILFLRHCIGDGVAQD